MLILKDEMFLKSTIVQYRLMSQVKEVEGSIVGKIQKHLFKIAFYGTTA